MRTRFNDYGELLRDRMIMGALMAGTDYVQALRRRRELCAITAAATKNVDVLVTAGAPAEAPRIDAVPKWGNLSNPGFTNPFNLTGWPAISVCSGFGEGGLPVSVQIAAKPFQETLLLRVADAFEKAAGLRGSRPGLATLPAGLEAGLAAAGLRLPPSDMAGLGAVVADLAAGAASLKGLRPLDQTPAAAFHLEAGE